MTPQLFRKEIEVNFSDVEFFYDGLTAQTFPADNNNISIFYETESVCHPLREGGDVSAVTRQGWTFCGKNACNGYGNTLAEAIADSAKRYQDWLDEMGKQDAQTAIA